MTTRHDRASRTQVVGCWRLNGITRGKVRNVADVACVRTHLMPARTHRLIRVFARYEPTNDPIANANLCRADLARALDVAIYRDAAATQRMARFNSDRKRPNRRTKFVTLNCWNWAIHWLPSVKQRAQALPAAESATSGSTLQ